MKILIMGFSKIKYMPYINFYFENIDSKKNDVHILYWNRDLKDENLAKYDGATLHEFRLFQEDYIEKKGKIKSFLKYRQYAKRIIKKERFDFIFVLTTLPAVLLSNILAGKYTGKYIFDYRDSTYERYAPYKKFVSKLVRNSYATFVSSDGFRGLLPSECAGKIYTTHNLLCDSLAHRDEKRLNGVPSDKIRIAYWGQIRSEETNRYLIKALGNDERFELHYYGREQQVALNLKAYAQSLHAENIFFHGEYVPEERYEFVRKTDIIHNVFGDKNMMIAMGNKYYDGAIFRIPQLCMEGSYMGECVRRAGIGLLCASVQDKLADYIYDYYSKIERNRFYQSCDTELNRVLEEYQKGEEVIRMALMTR